MQGGKEGGREGSVRTPIASLVYEAFSSLLCPDAGSNMTDLDPELTVAWAIENVLSS